MSAGGRFPLNTLMNALAVTMALRANADHDLSLSLCLMALPGSVVDCSAPAEDIDALPLLPHPEGVALAITDRPAGGGGVLMMGTTDLVVPSVE
jgi:hypothetical protein